MQDEKEVQDGRLVLQVELPTFPHAVVYQQAATAPATPADLGGTASDRSGPNLQVISDPEVLPPSVAVNKSAGLARASASCGLQATRAHLLASFVYYRRQLVNILTKQASTQVNRENPSELKAAKLARSMARGVEDRDLKPNTKERQQIEAVIVAPPNRHATVSQTPNPSVVLLKHLSLFTRLDGTKLVHGWSSESKALPSLVLAPLS